MGVMTSAQLPVQERCKNFTQGNATDPHATKDNANDTDFGAVMYIIVVLTFYSLGIVVMIVKYLKTEQKEMEEEMVLDSFFKGIPDKKIEHQVESVNRVAIHAFHTLTASRAAGQPGGSFLNSLESCYTDTHRGRDPGEAPQSLTCRLSHQDDFDSNHNQRDASIPGCHSQPDAHNMAIDPLLGIPRRKRRVSHNRKLDEDPISSGYPDDKTDGLAENANDYRYTFDTKVDIPVDNRSYQTIEKEDYAPLDCDEQFSRETCLSDNVAKRDGRTPDAGDRRYKKEKSNGKRNKTVIFSDARKPSFKGPSDSPEGKGHSSQCGTKDFLESARNTAPGGSNSSRKSNLKSGSPFQGRFQIEPFRLGESKNSVQTFGSNQNIENGNSPRLSVSSSCNAICGVLKKDSSGDVLDRSRGERHSSIFVNECSPLNKSNPTFQPYKSTSSKHVTTRVKMYEPINKEGPSSRVLVTDL